MFSNKTLPSSGEFRNQYLKCFQHKTSSDNQNQSTYSYWKTSFIWQLLFTLASVPIIVRCCSVTVKYPDVPHSLTSLPRRLDSAPLNNYIIALLRLDLPPLTKWTELMGTAPSTVRMFRYSWILTFQEMSLGF